MPISGAMEWKLLVYFIAIWNMLPPLAYFKAIWYIFPVLVGWTKKNLASLLDTISLVIRGMDFRILIIGKLIATR
jgi:hypothetical protein